MRYVPRTADRWTRAGVRGCVPGRGDSHRDRERGGVAAKNIAAQANAPGMPSADDSISTTRITLPATLPQDMGRVDTSRVEPEHPHWPLIFMTVLDADGGRARFAAIWLSQIRSRARRHSAFLRSRGADCAAGLGCLHPASGPAHSCFSRIQHVASLMAQPRSADVLALCRTRRLCMPDCYGSARGRALGSGIDLCLLGLVGVYASARLYTRSGPPGMEQHPHFAGVLSQRCAYRALASSSFLCQRKRRWRIVSAWPASHLASSDRSSSPGCCARVYSSCGRPAQLLRFRLLPLFYLGLRSGACWHCALLLASRSRAWPAMLLPRRDRGLELSGRYLFFVSVVPKNMAHRTCREKRGRMNLRAFSRTRHRAGKVRVREGLGRGSHFRAARSPNTGSRLPAAIARSAAE